MSSAWSSPSSSSRPWRSGPWSLELREDEFAEIRFDGRRVLRSIRAVVRDRNWATAALVVDRVRETDSTLTLHVRSDGLGSSFAGIVRVESRAQGLHVICDLESAAAFGTNRTGLVVLHPHQLAGNELTVTHGDGSVEGTRFPAKISPHQPVLDIAGLAWMDEGLSVDLRFAGDVFEMEDQRNWSDASFKTYSRPLALAYPYRVEAGERVSQQVWIAAAQVAPPSTPATRRGTSKTVIELQRGGAFPEILVGASTAPDPPPTPAPIGYGVLVELDLGSSNWRAALARARAGGHPLDVRITLPRADVDAALGDLADMLTQQPAAETRVLRAAAFDPLTHVTDAPAAAALRSALNRAGIDVPVVGGARSHFTEYNRERQRIPQDLDGIVVTTTPLFHSLGTEQLVESLAVQRVIAEQTVATAGGAPVHIGPVSLRPRFNNVATVPEPGPTRADLAEGYGAQFTGSADPRQSAPELAAWTIASAAALSTPGVASIAWFEDWGPRGIRSAAGQPFPVAAAIEALAALGGPGAERLWGESPDGLVWAIGASRRGEAASAAALVANLDDRARQITVVIDGVATTATVEQHAFARLVVAGQ